MVLPLHTQFHADIVLLEGGGESVLCCVVVCMCCVVLFTFISCTHHTIIYVVDFKVTHGEDRQEERQLKL